jgi:glycosyltransferase involved in cell wall biosynthesis
VQSNKGRAEPLLAVHSPPVSHDNRRATVAYVIDRFPRGSHSFVLHEILALERRGVDVHVFSLGMPDGRHDDIAAALSRLQSPVGYFLADTEGSGAGSERTMFVPDYLAPDPTGSGMTSRAAHWLARHVNAQRIEHLHAHGAAVATDVVREASRMTGRGYSFTAHARDLHEGDAPSVREKVLEAQFAVALSEFDYGRLFGICGRGAASKLHRIPMSVDPQDYEFAGRGHLRNAILTVGPLVEKSGFVDLIEAMRILRGRGLVARATIVGEGEFEAPLRARIDRHGLTAHVDIVTTASRREIDALIQTHTVMVLPWTTDHGDRDVLSNLVLEGMAAGLPVLSTDGPSIRELIDDGLNGRVFNSRDPLGLAGALETFFASPRLRESMASNARTTVERVFASRQNVAHLANLFSGIVAGKSFSA